MIPAEARRRALEFLVQDLALLNLRVDSLEVSMKASRQSVDTMITTLKHIISEGYLDKPGRILSGDMT